MTCCQILDAEVADLLAQGVQFEEFDMPGATVKDGAYDRNGHRGPGSGIPKATCWPWRSARTISLLIGRPCPPIQRT